MTQVGLLLVTASMAVALCVSQSVSGAENDVDINDLQWLAGEWIGEGQQDDSGEVEGVARQYWTPPIEGSVSMFFTWHAADSQHVHYAVNIFQQTEEGIFGKGIHYGPDFKNFEENPWHLTVAQIGGNFVNFLCTDHCRSQSVTFTLLDGGVMEERWILRPEENRPDWVVRYRRAD